MPHPFFQKRKKLARSHTEFSFRIRERPHIVRNPVKNLGIKAVWFLQYSEKPYRFITFVIGTGNNCRYTGKEQGVI
jgi:hypothetical protein